MLARPLRFLSVALLVLGTTAPAEADASEPSAPAAAIDRFVRGWMAANGVPGLALAVTRDVRIVHLRGYGDAGNGRPVTPDTQFLVASLSKSFTALAVLQLVQAGRVNLDAPVAAYLPGFTVADRAETAKITVRMLLNQTSGIADAGFPEMTLPQPTTITGRMASLGAAGAGERAGDGLPTTSIRTTRSSPAWWRWSAGAPCRRTFGATSSTPWP